MQFELNKLAIDKQDNFVTHKSETTIRDQKTGDIIIHTIEVHENKNSYRPEDLSELTEEQYQEYIKEDEELEETIAV